MLWGWLGYVGERLDKDAREPHACDDRNEGHELGAAALCTQQNRGKEDGEQRGGCTYDLVKLGSR